MRTKVGQNIFCDSGVCMLVFNLISIQTKASFLLEVAYETKKMYNRDVKRKDVVLCQKD